MKSFVYNSNINRHKRRASYTKQTKRNNNKRICLQNQQTQTETNRFIYKINIFIKQKKQTIMFKSRLAGDTNVT